MSESDRPDAPPPAQPGPGERGSPRRSRRSAGGQAAPRPLPRYRVLLRSLGQARPLDAAAVIVTLTPLSPDEATACVELASENGAALLLVTHKERAELYQQQFEGRGLSVSIEPEA